MTTRPPAAFDLGPSDDLVRRPIASLDQDVGEERGDDLPRSILGEPGQIVDVRHRRQDLEPLLQREYGTQRSLELPDGSVRVQGDDEDISPLFSFPEEPDVAPVKEVETAVGENDRFPFRRSFLRTEPAL